MWKDVDISYREQDKRSWRRFLEDQAVTDCVNDFRQNFRGEAEFLQHLFLNWRGYTGEYVDSYVSEAFAQRWKDLHNSVRATLEFLKTTPLPFEDHMHDAPILAHAKEALTKLMPLTRNLARIKASEGRPRQHFQRMYWCASLLPYFKYKGRNKLFWDWLGRWLAVIDRSAKTLGGESLRKWWELRVINPAGDKLAESKRRHKTEGRAYMSLDYDPLRACTEYFKWTHWNGKPINKKSYRRAILHYIPFADQARLIV